MEVEEGEFLGCEDRGMGSGPLAATGFEYHLEGLTVGAGRVAHREDGGVVDVAQPGNGWDAPGVVRFPGLRRRGGGGRCSAGLGGFIQ